MFATEESYPPGSYHIETQNVVAGAIIHLVGQGSYYFCGDSLTTGANSIFDLAGGASCNDVHWDLTTFSSGANSIMVGSIQATTADLGANSILYGTIVASSLTVGDSASMVPC
jgi:hypothetical protein